MKSTVIVMIILCLIGGSAIVASTNSSDDSVEAIKDRWIADQKFVSENYIYTEVHTKDSDFKNGKFTKQEIETQELMVVSGKLMSREIRPGKKYKFQAQEEGSLAANSESIAKFMSLFNFVDKQSIESPMEPSYDEVILKAKPGEIKGDFEKVATKMNIKMQIWTSGPDSGTIKALTGSLFLKKGEEVKIKKLFGLVGADVVSFSMKLTTHAIEGKVVPKTIEFDYEIHGTGLAGFVKRKQHQIVEFVDYRKVTAEQKSAYLKQ